MKNYLFRVFLASFLVIIILLPLYYLPQAKVFGLELKPIDILSDLRTEDSTVVLQPPPAIADTCPAGFTCIEDYSDHKTILNNFFAALDQSNQRTVRIAFYGDSFIEGDILTAHLRSYFQNKFGGCGVGFMPLNNSEADGHRRTIIHYSKGFDTRNIVLNNFRRELLSMGGSYYIPTQNVSITYQGNKYLEHLDTISSFQILYINNSRDAKINYRINGSEAQTLVLSSGSGVQKQVVTGNIGKITLSVPDSARVTFLGAYLDGKTGVCVDNYSMRSHSGMRLLEIPVSNMRQTDSLLNYDLIFLEYGLNVIERKRSNYKAYQDQMNKVIANLKAAFPRAGIVIVGVGDRSCKENGKYVTMPGVLHMINAQREMAQTSKIAFWDMFTGMGGLNCMDSLVCCSPPKANKDYTHITNKGGEFIADILFRSMMAQKDIYDKKQAAKLEEEKRKAEKRK